MSPILAWGMDVVRAVQEFFGKAMLVPMEGLSFPGSELCVLVALPFIYWCVDRKKGIRISVAILVSVFLNQGLKTLTAQPRPYDFEPALGLSSETTYGFPSGHSQTSVVFWGSARNLFPNTLGWILAVAVPLLVGISRVYLGVHFPTDVFAGWGIGVVLLLVFGKFGPPIEAMMHEWPLRFRLISAAIVSVCFALILPDESALAGGFLGCAFGFALASKRLRFDARGAIGAKALRFILGMAGLAILYFVPKLLIGDMWHEQDRLIRFLRYGLMGIWASCGAPWCFLKLKLVGLEKDEG